jgi:hypothetical protein
MSTPARAPRRRTDSPSRPSPRPQPRAAQPRAAQPRAAQPRAAQPRAAQPRATQPRAGGRPSAARPPATSRPGARSGDARGNAAVATSAVRSPQRVGGEERPDLRVVAPERGRTLRLRILGAVAATLLFGALLGLAVFHSVLVQGQLQLDGLDDQIAEEQVRQSELRFEEARLAAPERIQAEAARLGMVPPVDREYLQAVVPGSVVPPPGSGE